MLKGVFPATKKMEPSTIVQASIIPANTSALEVLLQKKWRIWLIRKHPRLFLTPS